MVKIHGENMDIMYEIKGLRIEPMQYTALFEIVDGYKRLTTNLDYARDIPQLLRILIDPVHQKLEGNMKLTNEEIPALKKKLEDIRERIREEEERKTSPTSMYMVNLRREEKRIHDEIQRKTQLIECIKLLDETLKRLDRLLEEYLELITR